MSEVKDEDYLAEYRLFMQKRQRQKSDKIVENNDGLNVHINLDSDMQRSVKVPRKNNYDSTRTVKKPVTVTYNNKSMTKESQEIESNDIGLYREYVQWDYINNRLYPFGEGQLSIHNPKSKQEYINTMQRWLIYINEKFNDVPKYEYYTILPNIDENHVAAHFLTNAFYEKRFYSSQYDCKNVVKRILSDIRANHRKVVPSNLHPPIKLRFNSFECILEVDKFNSNEVPRIKLLLKKADMVKTARMLLRYESFGNGSYQWGDPVTVHRSLHDQFYVRYEGFASPVNSRFIEYDDTHFCSLFPETDEPFGSLGDFFSVDMSKHKGGWSVNPPFLNDLMKKVADHIIKMLDKGYSVYFFCTFPFWEDDEGWQALNTTKHLHRRFDLTPRHFEVQDAYGRKFQPNMEMTMFVLGKIPPSCKLTELGQILILKHRERLPLQCPW